MVLRHLSQSALSASTRSSRVFSASISKAGRHPNVLAYIDSWEEDEALFIQTELCEKGNLARFLWRYGQKFPRLDEARVWKIVVDLSRVCNRFSFSFHLSSVLRRFAFWTGSFTAFAVNFLIWEINLTKSVAWSVPVLRLSYIPIVGL